MNIKLFDELFLILGINYWKLGLLIKLEICSNYCDANNCILDF